MKIMTILAVALVAFGTASAASAQQGPRTGKPAAEEPRGSKGGCFDGCVYVPPPRTELIIPYSSDATRRSPYGKPLERTVRPQFQRLPDVNAGRRIMIEALLDRFRIEGTGGSHIIQLNRILEDGVVTDAEWREGREIRDFWFGGR